MQKAETMIRRYLACLIRHHVTDGQKKAKGKGKKQLDSDEDSMRKLPATCPDY